MKDIVDVFNLWSGTQYTWNVMHWIAITEEIHIPAWELDISSLVQPVLCKKDNPSLQKKSTRPCKKVNPSL